MAHVIDELRLLREGDFKVHALSLPLLYTSACGNIKLCVLCLQLYRLKEAFQPRELPSHQCQGQRQASCCEKCN